MDRVMNVSVFNAGVNSCRVLWLIKRSPLGESGELPVVYSGSYLKGDVDNRPFFMHSFLPSAKGKFVLYQDIY